MKERYTIIIWENKHGKKFLDTKKRVLLVEIRVKDEDKRFEQNDIDDFIMRLSLNPDYYDNPYSGVDSQCFSSNKDYDLSFFFVEKDNSIKMSIVSQNKKAKKKLYEILKNFGGNSKVITL